MNRFIRQSPLLFCGLIVALLFSGCASKSLKTEPGSQISSAEAMEQERLRLAKKNARKRSGSHLAGDDKYTTLWERLFSLYALPSIENKAIDREVSWFASHTSYLDRAQSRAQPFLYSIVRHIEKQQVPGELALLPIVESAFQPHAVSPANAAGIWQFIPETGKRYGLKKSRFYDGRRDVYASTRAAVKYLKKLHDKFGDWLLAIAAYNCGEGAVARAIQKNELHHRPTDFWSLDLPEETRAYVPRLIAVSRVFAENEKYGVALHHMPNEALFKAVKMTSQLDLALAADAADISMERLFELNPGFKHKLTDVPGTFRLYIPADKTRTFRKELNRLAMERQFEAPDVNAAGSGDDRLAFSALTDSKDDYNPNFTNDVDPAARHKHNAVHAGKVKETGHSHKPDSFSAGKEAAKKYAVVPHKGLPAVRAGKTSAAHLQSSAKPLANTVRHEAQGKVRAPASQPTLKITRADKTTAPTKRK